MAFSLKKLLLVCCLTLGGAGLLSTPLLLRFSVYSEEALPLGYQDVVPLRWRISTLWCQNQTAMSTHTFNAYLYEGAAQANATEHSVQGSRLSLTCCPAGRGTKLYLVAGLGKLKACLSTVTGRNSSWYNWSYPVPPMRGPVVETGIRRNMSGWFVPCASEVSVELTQDACAAGPGTLPKTVIDRYEVPADGYYYLLFLNDPASEAYNDVQLGVMAWRSVFDRNQSLDACIEVFNCSLPLAFRSGQFVVAERIRSLPARSEPVFLRTRCEPRRQVYFLFYITFAVLFVVAAFQ